MTYKKFKRQSRSFIKKHPEYFWTVFEASMVIAFIYSAFGLIFMLGVALAATNALLTLLWLLLAPICTALLFVSASGVLTLMACIPYSVAITRSQKVARSMEAAK